VKLMLIGVQFNAGRTDRQEALFSLAEVSDELIAMVCALLLIKFEGLNVVTALLCWTIPKFTHISLS
jgi:hypothetical protein